MSHSPSFDQRRRPEALPTAMAIAFFWPGREEAVMNAVGKTVIVGGLTLASGLLGFLIQWVVPVQALTDGKGMVGPVILQLDFALERYGPDARAGRELLHGLVARARERFWRGKGVGRPGSIYSEARGDLRSIADFFASLKPAKEEQREFIGAAKQAFARIVETTLLMARQLANPVPLLLMVVVVGWSALLFFCFGLLAPLSWISVLAQFLGSLAVAAAFFMILEFSSPYSGLFRISPVGIDSLIKSMGG
jgi:hypothetical protein